MRRRRCRGLPTRRGVLLVLLLSPPSVLQLLLLLVLVVRWRRLRWRWRINLLVGRSSFSAAVEPVILVIVLVVVAIAELRLLLEVLCPRTHLPLAAVDLLRSRSSLSIA